MLVYSSKHHGERTELKQTPKLQRDRFVLSDDEVLALARWAVAIERHYGRGMDIEWARDGETGDLYVLQARPETVQSRKAPDLFQVFRLRQRSAVLVTGRAVGSAVAAGPVCRIDSPRQLAQFRPGSVLVTEMTDPEWVPIMRQAAAIVTDLGGRTCHAAIVSRELGVPAIVGTGNGTAVLADGANVTVSCAEGETGYVYEGQLPFKSEEVSLGSVPATRTEVMVNLAVPEGAFSWHRLPADGIGLARTEFIFSNSIKVHPLALLRFDELTDEAARATIMEMTRGYEDRAEYLIERLAEGVATLASAFWPKPVIVRMSDFKTNEYANLIGGAQFEPKEDNPMLGFRGASRYYSDLYRPGFDLECAAMKRARNLMGLTNIVLMIPFCRTLEEADRVLEVLAENGLRRGEDGLQVYVMAEIPSNIVLAREFAERFDGFSIGSNDLTQLVLGVDRDSARLAPLFSEMNPAVTKLILELIAVARETGTHVGICGQAPSDHPEFAEMLVRAGIDSMSLNPDRVVPVRRLVAEVERSMGGAAAARHAAARR